MGSKLTMQKLAAEKPDARIDGLPASRTSFVGRGAEIATAEERLKACRVLTLVGAGGAGKSRLALEIAWRVRAGFSGAVHLVDLSSVAAGELVPAAVALQLRLPASPGRTPLDVVAEHFRDRRALLVLDGCEHVIEACASLTDSLTKRCRALSVLTTSRTPLRISGEAVLAVPPLPINEAVYLFADRAAAALAGFVLTAQNRKTVAEICARLDGLPLAIELAAPLVAILPPAEIERQLTGRFDVLPEGPRDVAVRHRSLRASIEWSYELLTDQERQLFRQVSVFEQIFSTEAAAHIALHSASGDSMLHLLSRLVEKSMLTVRPDLEDPRRYRPLQTLREFGLEQLRVSGELGEIQRRHCEYFLRLAESAYEQHWTSGSMQAIHALAQSIDELRAALHWSRDHDSALHLRLAAALDPYWRTFGLTEGLGWLRSALERYPPPAQYGSRALLSAGTLASYARDAEGGLRMLAEARALAIRDGDRPTAAWAELELGIAAWLRLELEDSRHLLETSRETMHNLHNAFGSARSALHLGVTLVWQGDLQRGRELLDEATVLCAGLEDGWGVALAEEMLGWAAILGHHPEAAVAHLHASTRADILGPLRAGAVEGLAQVAASARDPRRAARLLGIAEGMLNCFDGQCAPVIAAQSRDLSMRLSVQLGAAELRRLMAQGRGWELADGIAYALCGQLPGRDDGQAQLTKRELEVARLVAKGLTYREIAGRLYLSVRTVESHVDHALNKLDLRSRTQLAVWVQENVRPSAEW